MKNMLFTTSLVLSLFCSLSADKKKLPEQKEKTMSKIYSVPVETLAGKKTTLEAYKGKVLLIVNTASKCGLTPQYEGLEKLYQEYKEQGLVILGFPCNQFGQQEPGTSEEISQFCKINYGVTFPLFSKIEVNGDKTHPLFEHLKKELPGIAGKKIKWNFTKFLIDKNGLAIKRFAPMTKPKAIAKKIEKLLASKQL